MTAIQLELDFKQQLQEAQTSPTDDDWKQLWIVFDNIFSRTHWRDQLELAAEAIYEMAELHTLRADAIFEKLRFSPDEEPVLSDDFLADLFVQERPLDLDDLIAEPELYVRSPSDKTEEVEGTVVEYQDKEEVLAVIEPEIQEEEMSGKDVALGASHVEDVGAWVNAIREFLEGKKDAVLFSDLVRELGLAPVAVLIGVLLGGFRVEQQGGFYGGEVWVG
ncbi:hypothetical protein [Acaryochloris sp. IP29b_bin.148]|uniref:hypothetical protein n=1 Tax=Acaryochloris sp. IP29b_bin.148 TaxID=2969218 RepID=UPI00260A4C06|nr:hypothetical protein [Acaryochloris sp. IP29b_bin.148]